MPTVEAILRDDADVKRGGDVVQTRAYLEILASHGFDVRETAASQFRRSGGSADVALVFNTARPIEWVGSVAAARPDVGLVGVPIHHPEPWFDEFETAGRTGLNRVLGVIRPNWRRSAFKAAVRRPSLATVGATLRPSRLSKAMTATVERIDSWVFLARGELEHLQRDLTVTVTTPAFFVPNGVEEHPPAPNGTTGDALGFDVLMVGRVEERKNVNHAIRALAGSGLSIGIIGAKDRSCPRYIRDFEELVATDPDVTYLGTLPHERVLEIMSHSRVYLSPSWFEVVSLAELEAASAGMRVVGTERSFGDEYIDGRLSIDPRDQAQLSTAVAEALRVTDEGEDSPSFPWSAGADALLEAVDVAASAARRRSRQNS